MIPEPTIENHQEVMEVATTPEIELTRALTHVPTTAERELTRALMHVPMTVEIELIRTQEVMIEKESHARMTEETSEDKNKKDERIFSFK
jgi:hypothetical protein